MADTNTEWTAQVGLLSLTLITPHLEPITFVHKNAWGLTAWLFMLFV